jgi:hypothetical protein
MSEPERDQQPQDDNPPAVTVQAGLAAATGSVTGPENKD